MTELLSQDEITKLLDSINAEDKNKSGGGGSNDRPNKFTREQILEINIIHDKFSLMANKSLSDLLRSKVHINVASVDQLFMDEFLRTIPEPSTLGVVKIEPLNGNAIFEFDPAITVAIINNVTSGKRKRQDSFYDLNDTEKKLLEKIISVLLRNLRDAWLEIVNLQPKLEKIEPEHKYIKNISHEEWVMVVTLESNIFGAKGMFNFCYPYNMIQPILEKLFV